MEKSDLDTFNVDEFCKGLNGKTRMEAAKAIFRACEGFKVLRHAYELTQDPKDKLSYDQETRCKELENQLDKAYGTVGDIKSEGEEIYEYQSNIQK